MFMHLGGDCMIKLDEIVFIVNVEKGMKPQHVNDFLKKYNEKGRIQKITGENYKSMVITDNKIYFSPISSQTLKKRAGFINKLAE